MKSLSIHLTDKCNNSCNFCVVNSSRESKEKVNQKIIHTFLEENKEQGYDTVNLHGGEPTTLPELLEILEDIKRLGYRSVSMQTNARLLKDKEYTKQIIDRGVNLFVISLHGKNALQQDAFTDVKGSFDETIEGIKNVILLGKKVRTNTVVCKENASDLLDIVKLSVSLGVQHINISALHPTGKAFKNFYKVTPLYSDIKEQVKKSVDYVKSKGIVCTLEGFPYCVLDDYHKHMIDWEQNSFKLLYRTSILNNYDQFMRDETRKRIESCKACNYVEKCGGVYKEYLMYYGKEEFNPIKESAGLKA